MNSGYFRGCTTYKLITWNKQPKSQIFFLFGLTSRIFSNWFLTHSPSIDTDLHIWQSSYHLISLSIGWYHFPWRMGNPMNREKATFSFFTVSIRWPNQAHYLWIIAVYDGNMAILCRHKLYNIYIYITYIYIYIYTLYIYILYMPCQHL